MANRIELAGNTLLGGASNQGKSVQGSNLLFTDLPMGDARFFYAEEELTLSKSAADTTSTQVLFPANALILAVTWRITEALVSDGTSLTALQFGDGTTAARWGSQAAAGDAIALNVTGVGGTHLTTGINSATTGALTAAAKNLVTTITGSSPSLSAGKVKVCVYGILFTPPTA